jgi:hypothetical protein
MVEALVDSYDEIILNNVPMKTVGRVPDVNLSVFGGKVVTGDYTKDSNPLLSAWVTSDLSGGLGVVEMNEGVDVNRYNKGSWYTRYPGKISRRFKVKGLSEASAGWNTNLGSAAPRFLSDILVAGTWQGIISIGVDLYRLSTTVTIGALTAAPVGNAVTYRGAAAVDYVVVPMGASGVARISTAYAVTNTAAGATCPAAQAIVIWDNKLLAIDTAGQLWYSLDPTAAWTSYGATAKLPSGSVPRALVRYFDRQGQPACFVVSDTEVWQFNPDTPEFFSVDVNFPPHPYHGLAACRWGGDLYFSVGLGVHRYTGGSLSAMGLDRDDGVPLVGFTHIVGGGLVPGYNSMYALTNDSGGAGSYSALYEWTGTGWNQLWSEALYGLAVDHSIGISRHEGNYRLYWGVDGASDSDLFYLDLPISFANPSDLGSSVAWGNPTYGGAGVIQLDYLVTSTFDAGMKGYLKLANALDVTIKDISATGTLTVSYFIDGTSGTLGTITTEGTTSLPFGTLANGIYPGMLFESISLQFSLADTSDDPFVMESAVLSYVALKPSSYSWTVQLNLEESHGGSSPRIILAALDSILTAGVMVPFVLRGTTYRVFLSQVQGAVSTGADESANRTISLLQIPQTLGAG